MAIDKGNEGKQAGELGSKVAGVRKPDRNGPTRRTVANPHTLTEADLKGLNAIALPHQGGLESLEDAHELDDDNGPAET